MQTLDDVLGLSAPTQAAPTTPQPSGMLRRFAQDTGVSAVKAAIGVPQALIGVGDLVSNGYVGKGAEALGIRIKDANDYLDTLYTPETQAAMKQVNDADGFVDTAAAMLKNPSTIYHGALTSAGSMLAGAPFGEVGMLAGATPALRAAMAAAPKAERAAMLAAGTRTPGWLAAGIGEGAATAGQNIEQIRSESPDGLVTPTQSAITALSGAITAGITSAAGKLSNKLGIGDINQMIVGAQQAGPVAQKALARKLAEGFATEGVLQELPQSWQEQVAQNIAQGKPWDQGAANASVQGAFAGGATGAAAAHFHGGHEPGQTQQPQPTIADIVAPDATLEQSVAAAAAVVARRRPAPVDFAANAPRLPVGEATEMDVSAPVFAPGAPVEPAQAPAPIGDPWPGDIGSNLTGKPFTTMAPAMGALARAGEDTHELVRVNGGLVVRAKDAATSIPVGEATEVPFIPAGDATELPGRDGMIRPIPVGEATELDSEVVEAPGPPPMQADMVPRRNAGAVPLDLSGKVSADAYVNRLRGVNTMAARALVQSYDSGILSPQDIMQALVPNRAPEPTPDQRLAAAAAQAPKVQPGDLLTLDNQTYGTRIGANKRLDAEQERNPEFTGSVVLVPGSGFVVRPESANVNQSDVAGTARQPAGSRDGRAPADVGSGGDLGLQPAGDGGSNAAAAAPVPGGGEAVAARGGSQPDATLSAPEFVPFPPASGSLGIPRVAMPQIDGAHRGALTNYLSARGITSEQAEVPAGSLKATQAEFSPAKVAKVAEDGNPDRSILVSSDGYVLDGHHQWLAKLGKSEGVKVIRFDAPIAQLLPLVNAFPSAGTDESSMGAKPAPAAPATQPQAAQAPAEPVSAAAPIATPAAPSPRKESPAVAKAHAAREAKRADYFTPGNIVQGYGGLDRVVSYTPGADGQPWSVRVQRVVKQGDAYVPAKIGGRDEQERNHSTEPEAKLLAAGPVKRAPGAAQPQGANAPEAAAPQTRTAKMVEGWSDDKIKAYWFKATSTPNVDSTFKVEKAKGDTLYGGSYPYAIFRKDRETVGVNRVFYYNVGVGMSPAEAWAEAIARVRGGEAPRMLTWQENALSEAEAAASASQPQATEPPAAVATRGGAEAFKAGKPRQAPVALGLKAKQAWLREFDAEKSAADAQKAEAAPASTPAATDGSTIVGRRADGVMIRADKNGVRFYAENGVRISESVQMRPTRDGVQMAKGELKPEFMTAEESKAEQAPTLVTKPTPSTNTIFTENAAAAARARLKAKLGRLQSGIDPETMMDGITLAGYHIEKGARTFAAYARAMVDDLGDAVKPYLQSWYMAVRADPRAEGMRADMDKASAVEDLDMDQVLAESEPASEKATLRDTLRAAIATGNMPKDNPALRKMVAEFDGAAPDQARMKVAQEDLEAAIVQTARQVVADNKAEGENTTFTILKRLYESQPNLNIRTSDSIERQAYSTPAPLAYLGARLAGITPTTTVYEPTAGSGMLTITAAPANVTATELDTQRAEILREQGITVTQGDALTAEVPAKSKDRVIANPPFGPIKNDKGESIKVKFDGYTMGQIDHLIAARALEAMKDDGKATLIIGANKATGQQSNNDLIFFNWLYGNYNVTSHFEVEGDLYQRQGAGWPVRVITIDGRAKSSTTAPSTTTIQRANTWSEVYDQFQHGMAAGRASAAPGASVVGARPQRADGARPVPGTPAAEAGRPDSSRPEGGARGNANVAGERAGPVGDRTAAPNEGVGERAGGVGSNDQAPGPVENAGVTVAGAAPKSAGNPGTAGVTSADPDNQFQTKYIARSDRKDEGVLIPVNMAGPTQDALNRLEDEVGNIDQFAANELGYASVADLHRALMGLQVDSVASAINQIKAGNGIIIADQTGIGKGRQAASIIRWAARNGKTPIFVTVKPSLFTDMYGDLHDIGTDDIAPMLMNSDASIKGEGDEKLFANTPALHRRTLESIAATGQLPAGRNALFMTYSQISVDNIQRRAVMALAPNAVFVLDESHNAGGASATGNFIKGALDLASGVTYLSATYAKRPDNMPVYFKTDIGQAVADDNTLTAAMAAGGLPLQTVVSNNLVKAGQMFRRERSYDGVSIESRADTEHRAEHVALSDETTLALRAIVSADRTFHHFYVKALQKQLEKEGSRVLDMAGNQAQESVDHTQFSSVVHNFVRQMLLGLKAQEAANDAIRSLKRGEKPLIAVENTMGSFLAEYAENNSIAVGGPLGAFDYRTVLSRALERSRYIVRQLPNGDKVKEYIPMSGLDPESYVAYAKAQAIIDKLKIDIPVSPIDWMRDQITKAGYSVAEVTGRNLSVDYSDPKNPKLSQIDSREQKDKVRTTRQFNDGSLDAIILNVAGSTGISLHASEKFKDQRQRHMIVAQAAQDINIFMQMLGRVHRTGQVVLPKYTLLSADLPAEIRPTALLSGKMKSLNANTSSNTESATSVKSADMLNKYGDAVVQQYLADNYELAQALDLDSGDVDAEGRGEEDIARKATGRLALMPVKVQEQFYAEVEEQYQALIDYLNKTNQNDLEPRTFDFDAQETKSAVLFEGQNKASPFGEDAIYGEYSVKAQGKAMTPVEIRAAMDEHLAGQAPAAHVKALADPLRAAYLKMRDGLADDAQKEKADSLARAGAAFLDAHKIGAMFRVDINGESYNAIITNIRSTHKAAGNPFSLSKIQVTIAVNGALRSVTLPATQFGKIEVSRITGGFGSTIEAAFKVGPPNEREVAKIVTGNLLGAYGEIEGTRGSIITFSKADGTTEQGILLPKAFNFTKDVKQDYRLKTGADVFKFVTTSTNDNIDRFGINSRDQVVRVLPSGRDGITIQVPKSRAKGGKYFLDNALRAAAGDFVSSGNFMRATITGKDKAVKALDVLMQKGALYALPSMAEEARSIVGDSEPTPGAMLSRTAGPDGITRRNLLLTVAAAGVPGAARAEAALGKARPLTDATLNARLSPAIEKTLRAGQASGTTNIEGHKAILAAMREIAATGPVELRPLAARIAAMLPRDGVMLTVDDKGKWNAHGAVEFSPWTHMKLFTADGRRGMTYGTFMHESLHLMVLAKYRTLSQSLLRSNDAKVGLAAPAAAEKMAQFRALWDEFSDVARDNPALDAETKLSVEEARGNPDEFFVRALTDSKFQTYLSGIEYEGKTLWARFKDWVTGLFIKSGVRPSWLDAALLASNELHEAAGQDASDYARSRAMSGFDAKRGAAQQDRSFQRASEQTETPAFRKWLGILGSDGLARLMQSTGNQSVKDGLQRNAQALSDLLERHPATSERGGGSNIPLSVVPHVLGVADNKQVLDAVIAAIPVDVMNLLARKQISAENLLRNKAMLKSVLAVDGSADVTLAIDKSSARALLGSIAQSATEIATDLAGGTFKVDAADGARQGNTVLGAHARSVTETKAFSNWFGDSKVVDAQGKPLVVYHGTGADVATFDANANPQTYESDKGKFFFTNDAQDAGGYADTAGGNANVVPVYLALKNPRIETTDLDPADWWDRQPGYLWDMNVASLGHDGLIVHGAEGRTLFVASRPEQIKSAIGNIGTFDPANPDIRFSRTLREAFADGAATVRDLNLPVGYKVNDFIESHGKLSWWDKTVGTPYNLAKRFPTTFGRVYDAVQRFLSDTSYYATEAGKLAPTLLPTLDKLSDIRKTPLSPADNQAIKAPVFEGTLNWTRDAQGKPIRMEDAEAAAMNLTAEEKGQELLRAGRLDPKVLRMWQGLPVDQYESIIDGKYASELLRPGVVWTDAELRSQFGLTDKQIGLYHETRTALDKSLDDLSISEMLRLGGKDTEAMRESVLGMDAAAASEALRDHLFEAANAEPDRADVLNKTADDIVKLGNRVTDLKAKGYAPLSRFGHYTLDVVNDGERVYFGLFESEAEANKMARRMRSNYPKAQIQQGTQDTESYKQFAGISPETLALFGDLVGLSQDGTSQADQVYQTYLKKAVNTRSALRRMIHRQGIAGFNEDVGRVLAGFIMSNARRTSSNLHMGEVSGAVLDMPKQNGELKTYAAQMAEYVQNPQEEAQAFRGLMFTQYLGGSVASAMVNMTQPIAVTFPYLSQFGGAKKAAGNIAAAFKDLAGRAKLAPDLDAALKHAEEAGIVSPQEVFQLMNQAQGKGALRAGDGTTAGNAVAKANNAGAKVMLAWGKLFSFAEQLNRRVTFIAAFRTAQEQGIANPAEFAANAVTETQFTYNKGNKPQWARGAVGGTLFTFKTYSVSYLELVARMWRQGGPSGKKAALLALATLAMMSGGDGLPFMEDVENLIDGFMQRVMGRNWSTRQKRNEVLADALGEDAQHILSKGLSAIPGMPIDVSGRFGMAHLIPGSGMLRKNSTASDATEVFGPAGDIAKRGSQAIFQAAQGDIGKAALTISPTAIRNVAKAADMAKQGAYMDASGKKVIDTTPAEAFMKGIGFQPNSVAQVQDASGRVLRMTSLNRITSNEIADEWAQALAQGDQGAAQEARDRLRQWNTDNPESPIRITYPQLAQRIKAIRSTRAERLERTAPAAIRSAVRAELVTQ